MTFLNPWAWLGVLAIAAPVLAHLLARRPARHLPFPNLRFLPATTPSPVRRDRLSDLWLLVLRAAIIASAAFALAQPLWLSNERARSLGVQIARAVIVDSSASMSRSSGNDGPAIDVARRLAQTTADDATTARVAEHFAPASAIQSAVTWLLTQPMRRELTIVSDFQTSTISRADLDRIPAAIGLRMIKVAAAGPVVEDRDATRELVLLTNAAGRDSAIAARSAAIAQGAPAQIRADRPVAIVFPGFETRPALLDRAQPLDAGWMFDVFSAVTEDPIVAAAAARLEHSPLDLLRVAREPASEHASLLVIADTPPNSLFAAAVIGSVLRAAAPQPPAGEVTATIYAADVLQGWERSPASVERADSARARLWSDARWAWLATVILLLLESLARRRRTRPQVETHARVA